MKYFALYSFVLFILVGCSGCSNGANSVNETHWYRPAVSISWQWQLQGQINTNYPAEVYNIDLFDSSKIQIEELHNQGKKVICYFSAGTYEDWREDATQFLKSDLGNNLEEWEGERWLDIRSDNVQVIMKNRLTLAQEKNCDGVEPDNVDGYTNDPGFDLTAADQLIFNIFLAKEAHARGLSIGLKNDLEQIEQLVDHFDFAVNEQCFEYNECDLLAPFINQGKPVLNAEYQTKYINNDSERNVLCVDSMKRKFSTLILPLELDGSFRYSCF